MTGREFLMFSAFILVGTAVLVGAIKMAIPPESSASQRLVAQVAAGVMLGLATTLVVGLGSWMLVERLA